jgi:cytochrome b
MSDDGTTASTALSPVRVWDLPTRVFHWVLAVTIIGSIVSGHFDVLAWHVRFGYLAFGLLLFRLVWGFLGGRWSRFASFAYHPGTLLRYLRGESHPDEHVDVGHSPLGAFSVFAMLLLLALQVATGLVADDEVSTTGPLNRYVSNAFAQTATAWHRIGQWMLIALIALHVSAIVYYRVRRDRNLVGAMLTGDKLLPVGTPAAVDGPKTRAAALLLAALAAAIVGYIVSLGG